MYDIEIERYNDDVGDFTSVIRVTKVDHEEGDAGSVGGHPDSAYQGWGSSATAMEYKALQNGKLVEVVLNDSEIEDLDEKLCEAIENERKCARDDEFEYDSTSGF